MTTPAITKTQTKPALLKAIADVAGAPNFAVPRDEVIPQCFAILGIDPASLGQDARGRSKAGRLVNSCFNELKNQSLCESPMRGKYALTHGGWTQATGLVSTPAPAPTPEVSEPAPTAPAPVQTALKAPTTGTSMTFQQRRTATDSYLLSLQVANSPCFGVSYSDRSKVCKGCPVAGLCVSARTARLSELAAQLQRMAAQGEATAVAAPVVEASLPEGALTIPIDHEVQCDHCQKAIQVGSNGILIPDAGMFHEGCVAAATA